jgi:hypothetical protein
VDYGSSPVPVVEHRSSATARWLRARRLRFALWTALAEGLLVLLHAIPWWFSILLAIGTIGFFFTFGRQLRSYTLRQVSWIAAVSQGLVILVPLLVLMLGWLALLAVVLIAVAAVVVLFSRR